LVKQMFVARQDAYAAKGNRTYLMYVKKQQPGNGICIVGTDFRAATSHCRYVTFDIVFMPIFTVW
jgi:hypothetical protein